MEKKRILNLCSLFVNLSVIFFTVSAIAYNFRSDVIVDKAWFGYRGWKSLRFFTNLSNVLVALSSAITLFYNCRNAIKDEYVFPKFAVAFKFVGTVAVSVTFFTVVFYLAPVFAVNGHGYFALFTGNNFFLHFFTPVLEIISFVFFEKGEPVSFPFTFAGLIPTALYSIVYAVMVVAVGEENGGWADFYGFTFGGKTQAIPFSVAGMLLLTYFIAFFLRFAAKKTEKPEK